MAFGHRVAQHQRHAQRIGLHMGRQVGRQHHPTALDAVPVQHTADE